MEDMHDVCIYVRTDLKKLIFFCFFLYIFELIRNQVFQFDLKFANGRYA